MSDTLITIVAILLAAILMFMFPLMSVSERSDDVSQLAVQTAVNEFVDTSATIGKITLSNYNELISRLNATGNPYNVEIEHKILDENIGKKSAWTQGTVIGENVYYSVYSSQILKSMSGSYASYNMKKGDIISVTAKNSGKTLAQMIRGVFYSLNGDGNYQISAQHSREVTATSSNN